MAGLGLTPEQLAHAIKNRDAILRQIEKANAEEKLIDFVRCMWGVLEPGRPMVSGWAMDAICEHLEAITAGTLEKVLINVPPGFAKSILTTVYWPAWEWGPKNRPELRYLAASYVQQLAIKHNRLCRHVMECDVYRALWGDRFEIASDQAGKELFANDKYGFKQALGVGGQTIGERGDRFILDDPHNTLAAESDIERENAVRWYLEAASSRHNNPDKPIEVVIMQRLHEYDVSGVIISNLETFGYEHLCIEMEFDPDHPAARKRQSRIGWTDPRADRYWAAKAARDVAYEAWLRADEVVRRDKEVPGSVPATELRAAIITTMTELPPHPEAGELAWPERHTPKAIEAQLAKWRGEGSNYAEAGQYQQWPVSRKGGMFDKTKATILGPSEIPHGGSILVRGWDFAGSTGKKSPYTVGVKGKLVDGRLFILDVIRLRVESADLDLLVGKTADDDDAMELTKQDFPQDPAQAGKAQRAHMGRFVLAGHDFSSSTEEKDKENRARPFAAQWNAGNVYLLRGSWNADYLYEVGMFPGGKYKDQVDASSRMYAGLLKLGTQDLPAPGQCVELGSRMRSWG